MLPCNCSGHTVSTQNHTISLVELSTPNIYPTLLTHKHCSHDYSECNSCKPICCQDKKHQCHPSSTNSAICNVCHCIPCRCCLVIDPCCGPCLRPYHRKCDDSEHHKKNKPRTHCNTCPGQCVKSKCLSRCKECCRYRKLYNGLCTECHEESEQCDRRHSS